MIRDPGTDRSQPPDKGEHDPELRLPNCDATMSPTCRRGRNWRAPLVCPKLRGQRMTGSGPESGLLEHGCATKLALNNPPNGGRRAARAQAMTGPAEGGFDAGTNA